MSENELPVDPRQLVRQFRQNYINVHTLRKRVPTAHTGAHLSTPKETPITEGNLPQGATFAAHRVPAEPSRLQGDLREVPATRER